MISRRERIRHLLESVLIVIINDKYVSRWRRDIVHASSLAFQSRQQRTGCGQYGRLGSNILKLTFWSSNSEWKWNIPVRSPIFHKYWKAATCRFCKSRRIIRSQNSLSIELFYQVRGQSHVRGPLMPMQLFAQPLEDISRSYWFPA